jgi:acyl phosphate:glycerol-3-phosphate acyltransferase
LSYLYCLWVLAAYLLGAVPTSYLAGRLLRGIDLRRTGSGNLGATNVFRTLGAGPAAAVLVFDMLKGLVPVLWFPGFSGLAFDGVGGEIFFRVVLGLAAMAGHVFSPFVGFRGGKGVATCAGVFLALCPKVLGLCVVVWIALMASFRIVSLASLGSAVALPVFVFLATDPGASGVWILRVFSLVIAAAVFLTHRANIGRLLRGQEKKLSRQGRDLS